MTLTKPFASSSASSVKRNMKGSVIVVALVVLSPTHLSAQTTTDSKIPTISIDVQVVNVLASVRDKSGQLVNNLTRDDFVVVEDGEPQEIRYFARQTDLPLTIGLLVDTSVSQERVIDPQKQAAAQFFEEILRHDKDLAFLISLSRSPPFGFHELSLQPSSFTCGCLLLCRCLVSVVSVACSC